VKGVKECLVASIVLIAAGLLLGFTSHRKETPLRQSFAHFPLRIDAWQGKELGLEPQVLRVLQVDDYMMRQYWDAQGTSVGLYVGYYQSLRQGAGYHSPKNCLPGSGWSFVKTGTTLLHVEGQNNPIEVNAFIIQKGLDKQLVLYWYQDRGRIITSEYWAKIYLVMDAIFKKRTDGTFVRLTIPFAEKDEAVVRAQGKAFAERIFPLLQTYLPS
jgi:EpsI family protein